VNARGDDVNTDHIESATLGWDTTRIQMNVPYLQWKRISEGVFAGGRRDLMRKGRT
jgi:hypothetical protein